MSEKKIYLQVILFGLITSMILAMLSYVVFKDYLISLGIIVGAFARIIGFLAIILNSFSIIEDGKNSYKSITGYIGRLLFYGIVIYFAIQFRLNVLGLLIGFSIVNIVLYVMQIMVKGGIQWKH